MLINFWKDKLERKTKSYFETRLKRVDTIYNEFHTDHKMLLFTADSTEEHFRIDSAMQFEEFSMRRRFSVHEEETTCSKCSDVKYKYSYYEDFSFEIENVNFLNEAMDAFVAPETLERRCEECDGHETNKISRSSP